MDGERPYRPGFRVQGSGFVAVDVPTGKVDCSQMSSSVTIDIPDAEVDCSDPTFVDQLKLAQERGEITIRLHEGTSDGRE